MRIVFSEHAIERMGVRNISELQVFATVKSPQEKQASYRDRIIYHFKNPFRENVGVCESGRSPKCVETPTVRSWVLHKRKFDNKTLEVVTKTEDKNMIIISAYMVK